MITKDKARLREAVPHFKYSFRQLSDLHCSMEEVICSNNSDTLVIGKYHSCDRSSLQFCLLLDIPPPKTN
jgi:hypothetical protein